MVLVQLGYEDLLVQRNVTCQWQKISHRTSIEIWHKTAEISAYTYD